MSAVNTDFSAFCQPINEFSKQIRAMLNASASFPKYSIEFKANVLNVNRSMVRFSKLMADAMLPLRNFSMETNFSMKNFSEQYSINMVQITKSIIDAATVEAVSAAIRNSHIRWFDDIEIPDTDMPDDTQFEAATVPPEEVEELRADIQLLQEENGNTTEKNWQQRFAAILQKWAVKNPVLFFVLKELLFVILVTCVKDQCVSLMNSTKVKEQPTSTANVIYQTTTNQTVVVVNEIPYYLEITFIDDEGNSHNGWVSKRRVLAELDESDLESETEPDVESESPADVPKDSQEEDEKRSPAEGSHPSP